MRSCLYVILFMSFPLWAGTFEEAQKLFLQDKVDEGLEKVTTYLKKNPEDEKALVTKLYFSKANGDDISKELVRLRISNAKLHDKVIRHFYLIGKAKDYANLPKRKVQLIIALGSPLDKNGKPQKRLLNTLTKTKEAALEYPLAKIIVTGGAVKSSSEADGMKKWLVENGIKEDRIIVENKARDTKENFINSFEIIKKVGVNQIGLVTVSYHMARALLIGLLIQENLKLKDIEFTPLEAKSDLADMKYIDRIQIEHYAIFRDALRTEGYWTH
jgi:vancomycin permeability regulator SanA